VYKERRGAVASIWVWVVPRMSIRAWHSLLQRLYAQMFSVEARHGGDSPVHAE